MIDALLTKFVTVLPHEDKIPPRLFTKLMTVYWYYIDEVQNHPQLYNGINFPSYSSRKNEFLELLYKRS